MTLRQLLWYLQHPATRGQRQLSDREAVDLCLHLMVQGMHPTTGLGRALPFPGAQCAEDRFFSQITFSVSTEQPDFMGNTQCADCFTKSVLVPKWRSAFGSLDLAQRAEPVPAGRVGEEAFQGKCLWCTALMVK